ncbi:MAG: signal peptidase I [Anaerolineales bacterium]|nr:signal peptidase I [Anaerolineales bacterium]
MIPESSHPEISAAPAAPSRARAFLREVLETIILTIVIYALVNFATGRYRVEGDSMLPTVHPNEYVLLDKLSYMLRQPKRGEIVVFHYPYDPERDFIKRIIGLPGETISIANGVVTVTQPDGTRMQLDEPYINAPPNYTNTWTVGPDEFFVLGDNRNNSSDSHSWGMLKREFLVGRALLVYWPLPALRAVDHHDYVAASSSD